MKLNTHIQDVSKARITKINSHFKNKSEDLKSQMYLLQQQDQDVTVNYARYQTLLSSGSTVGKLDEAEDIKEIELHNALYANAELKYTKCPNQLSLIEKALGEIDIDYDTIACSEPITVMSQTSAENHHTRSVKFYQVTSEISRFKMTKDAEYQSVTPISDETAWVVNIDFESSKLTKTFSLISNSGEELDTITLSEKLIWLSVHPQSDDLYGGFNDNTIRRISTTNENTSNKSFFRRITTSKRNANTTIKFESECPPGRFTFTPEGYIIVGRCNYETVYIYSLDGSVVHQTDTQHNVWYISVCPRTENIALACEKDGVVVMNRLLSKIHFTYKGRAPISGQSREPFESVTAVYDKHGNLLVGDFNNHEIQLVDGTNGRFVKVIPVNNISKPVEMELCNDNLWVGCSNPHQMICMSMR